MLEGDRHEVALGHQAAGDLHGVRVRRIDRR
jgi:hypothetical protein